VGIGFGLQEIVANFISGLIILFERPIRVGDAVTVGEISGTVSRIQIRATSITSWDRKELLVPNKEFIVGRLVNWTLSDQILRVDIPVGIAYGSDTEKATEVLLRVAKENPKVLDDPPPTVLFLSFGASSLDFELRAFSPDLQSFLPLRHELHMAVDRAFREAGIEIAFPQRDIHVRSAAGILPVAAKEGDEEAD
jgi:potassium efflux system protein